MTGARKVRPKPQALPAHAKTLLAIRHHHNWSQLDMANRIGVARETISRWERGVKEPHPSWWRLVTLMFIGKNGTIVTLPPDSELE